MHKETILLNNKERIPVKGLGTYTMKEYKDIKESIENALEIGYRHFDTAYRYENESNMGKVLQDLFKKGKIQRKDLFITTKFWNTQRDPLKGIEQSLKDLQLDYVDLYLIHFPVMFKLDENGNTIKDKDGFNLTEEFDIKFLWGRMEEIVKEGLAKSIGVSNFGIKTLTKLLKDCKIKPQVNQIEVHPYFQQRELIEFCNKNDIKIVSFSSFGGTTFLKEDSPKLSEDETLKKIAEKYQVSVFNVILSWLLSKGICIIPRSKKYDHLKENYNTIQFN